MIAGAVTIRKPLSVTGTFKSLEVAGRWIGLSETQDAACSQAGDRVFLCGNSDFPMPRDTEAWKVGDVLKRRAPSLSTPPSPPFVYEAICTTAGSSTTTAWTASTAYAAGNWVSNGARIYACATAGTSAGSGGPSGTGTAIADGTAAWDYVDSKAVFNVGVTLSVSP
jgi:hypothetical protein